MKPLLKKGIILKQITFVSHFDQNWHNASQPAHFEQFLITLPLLFQLIVRCSIGYYSTKTIIMRV